jgi:hypothetical protein
MKRHDDEPPAYLTVQRPRCPKCDSATTTAGKAALVARRSKHDQGDGSTIRYCQCRVCGARVVVILE